jgi:hypothetical protein
MFFLQFGTCSHHEISRDLNFCAMRLYEHEILAVEEILDCVGFSKRTTGDVAKHDLNLRTSAGQPRLLHFDDIDYLLQLIEQ